MRATMMSIFENVGRCIPRFGDLEEWKFNEVFCHPPANDLSVEEAAFEMYEYYKYWMERTFNGESFEVFDTLDGRGLGIRATRLISLGSLTLELPGFVEVIEYSLYAWLSNRGYPSLYRFYDLITEAWVYGILFGPLALVNTAVGITFGFTHLNLDGTDSCWRITYRFGEVFEDLGDGVSTVYRQHRLSIEDVDEDEDGDFHEPIQMDEHDRFQVVKMRIADNAKEVFFIRVYAFHPSAYAFVNKYYVKDEEVLLQYECHAI
jgi:hypothetical protein